MYLWVGHDDVLHIGRGDPLATRLDHILGTVNELDVAVQAAQTLAHKRSGEQGACEWAVTAQSQRSSKEGKH